MIHSGTVSKPVLTTGCCSPSAYDIPFSGTNFTPGRTKMTFPLVSVPDDGVVATGMDVADAVVVDVVVWGRGKKIAGSTCGAHQQNED